MQEVGAPPSTQYTPKHGVAKLNRVKDEAPDTPQREEALEMSNEETAALGNSARTARFSHWALAMSCRYGRLWVNRSDITTVEERSRRQPQEGNAE